MLTFEPSAGQSTKEQAMQGLALDSSDDKPSQDEEENDLLDLLDSVA